MRYQVYLDVTASKKDTPWSSRGPGLTAGVLVPGRLHWYAVLPLYRGDS